MPTDTIKNAPLLTALLTLQECLEKGEEVPEPKFGICWQIDCLYARAEIGEEQWPTPAVYDKLAGLFLGWPEHSRDISAPILARPGSKWEGEALALRKSLLAYTIDRLTKEMQ